MFGGWTSAVLLRAMMSSEASEAKPFAIKVDIGSDVAIRTSRIGGGRSVMHWRADRTGPPGKCRSRHHSAHRRTAFAVSRIDRGRRLAGGAICTFTIVAPRLGATRSHRDGPRTGSRILSSPTKRSPGTTRVTTHKANPVSAARRRKGPMWVILPARTARASACCATYRPSSLPRQTQPDLSMRTD